MGNDIDDLANSPLYTLKPLPDSFEGKNRYRRQYGTLLGIAMGLVFGLVSQCANLIALPGIPLYQPPMGPVLNTLLDAAVGGALGLVTTWSLSSTAGIFAGAAAAALITAASLLITGTTLPNQSAARILSVAFLTLPIAAAFVPVTGIFRWMVNKQEEVRDEPIFSLGRIGLPVLAVVVAGVVGVFGLYPARARLMLPRMHAMLQTAAGASEPAGLPAPFQPDDVDEFISRGSGYYELLWDRDESNKFAIPRLASTPSGQGVIVAHFDNGYLVACLWSNFETEPECRDY
jgi:hypothetical protein